MSDVVKIATRESYGNALVELGKINDKVYVLDADLAGATKTGTFKKAFPERHIDCGIAECNMTGIAAGLSTTGIIPFCSSFAMFAAGRAFEQVRNSIGYPHLNVKIGATHAGVTVGEDGATHQCNEDIALMRTIPGMTVIVPSDDVEAKAAVKAAAEYVGPGIWAERPWCQLRNLAKRGLLRSVSNLSLWHREKQRDRDRERERKKEGVRGCIRHHPV